MRKRLALSRQALNPWTQAQRRASRSTQPLRAGFKHPSLPSPASIRLVRLKASASRDAPLECHMTSFPLSSAPRYETLSYTWEEQTPSESIHCNGSEILVTPNVKACLEQLRRKFVSRDLWIDSMCINQSNLTERSQQVLLMAK